MIKYEIYDEVDDDDEEQPTVIRLALEYVGDRVRVVAVDEDGEGLLCSCLVTFRPDGTIHRHQAVDPDLGFQLDDEGRIKES